MPVTDQTEPSGAASDWDEATISLADAEVKRLCMPKTRDERLRGIVDFSRARAASYQDFAAARTRGPELRDKAADGRDIDHLVLNGFTYEHLNNPSGAKQKTGKSRQRKVDNRVTDRRLQWLEGRRVSNIRNHFKPQPWVQLENRLQQQDYDEDSRLISIARMRLERSSNATDTLQRWQGDLLDIFALYGFNPRRSVAWMVAFIALSATFWAWAGGQCTTVYPDFNPLAYSFDVFVPFVSFGYADHWRPNMAWTPIAEIPKPNTFAPTEDKQVGDIVGEISNPKKHVPTLKITLGGVLYGFIILETIIEIVLASLLIAGFTGQLRGD